MSAPDHIVVAGGGAFGTALAVVLSRTGAHKVTLLVRDADQARHMSSLRENKKRLPDVALPAPLVISCDMAILNKADILLSVVPSSGQMDFYKLANTYINNLSHFVICSKGFNSEDGTLISHKIRQMKPSFTLSVLSGPGFANDIARDLPTAMTLATEKIVASENNQPNVSDNEHLIKSLSRPSFRLYGSDDLIGVQVGGAMKNIIAIAAGITMGAGLGESARASIIARGLAEISRYIAHRGGQVETASGLSGLGDLVLTASSEQSRNYKFGLQIGQGQAVETLIGPHMPLVEGARAAELTAKLAKAENIDLPLTKAVAAIISGQLEVNHAIREALARPLKHEKE